MRRLFALLLLVCAMQAGAADLSPLLPEILASSAPTDRHAVLVFLHQRLTMDEVYPVAKSLPMRERREYVAEALKERFAQMSPKVMADLRDAEKTGEVTLLRPLWIINAIRVTASKPVIESLARNYTEILYIAQDPQYDNTLDNGWGAIETQAPEVWAQFGARGEGVLVGHKDSGVNFAGCSRFDGRIWFNPGEDLNGNGVLDAGEQNGADDDGNGYADDFYGWNFDDDTNDVSNVEASYHGTRTASVISSNIGATESDTVAIAPAAKLIVLRGYLSQGAVFESSQYAIEKGVNVISASLSFKQNECDDPDLHECPNYVGHRWVSEMELAAGIIHSNSTGNDGTGNPRPLSAAAPSNCPPPSMTAGHYQQGGVSSVVAVAGYNANGTFYTASGVGPSAWSRQDLCVHPRSPWCGPEGTPGSYPADFNDYPYFNGNHGLLKPDITAPTSVQSVSGSCGSASIGGTSGATPHVGGTLAVIYSAFPGITPEEAYQVLVGGALDAGDIGPDTTWGFGKLRVLASVAEARADRGAVSGEVTEVIGGDPLEEVRISIDGMQPVWTNADGEYTIYLPPGEYIGAFEKYGYGTVQRAIHIVAGQVDDGNLTMSVSANATLTLTVRDPFGELAHDILVQHPLSGMEAYTDANGVAQFDALFDGNQQFVLAENVEQYEISSVTYSLQVGANTFDADLTFSGLAEPTGPDLYGYYAYDNFDAGGPGFDWVELSDGTGANLNLTGDNCATRTLPFNMVFYGNAENELIISANGHIEVGTPCANHWSRWPIPLQGSPDNYIAVFFHDYRPELGGGVWYYYDEQHGRAIVQWEDVPEYFDYGRATFQAHIYDPAVLGDQRGNSVIDILCLEYTGRIESSIGIENATGTDGLMYSFQLQYAPHATPLQSGRAIRFTTDYITPAEEAPAPLPTQFVLHQNYPNPFNASTTFKFSVPTRSQVALRLYDVTGRETATLLDGLHDTGEHTLRYDATGLATGLYFARLEANGKVVQTRKILFLK